MKYTKFITILCSVIALLAPDYVSATKYERYEYPSGFEGKACVKEKYFGTFDGIDIYYYLKWKNESRNGWSKYYIAVSERNHRDIGESCSYVVSALKKEGEPIFYNLADYDGLKDNDLFYRKGYFVENQDMNLAERFYFLPLLIRHVSGETVELTAVVTNHPKSCVQEKYKFLCKEEDFLVYYKSLQYKRDMNFSEIITERLSNCYYKDSFEEYTCEVYYRNDSNPCFSSIKQYRWRYNKDGSMYYKVKTVYQPYGLTHREYNWVQIFPADREIFGAKILNEKRIQNNEKMISFFQKLEKSFDKTKSEQ